MFFARLSASLNRDAHRHRSSRVGLWLRSLVQGYIMCGQALNDRLGVVMPQWLERLKYQWNGWMDRITASLRPPVPALASSRLALLSSAATLCDQNGIILAVNAPFEALSGYRAEELVGQLAPALRSGLYDTGLMTLIQLAVAERGVWQGQVLSRHKSGRMLAEQLTVCSYQNGADPHLLCLVGLL